MARETSQICIDKLELVSGQCRDQTILSDARFDDWVMTAYWLQLHVDDCLADLRWAVEDTNKGIRWLLNRYPVFDYDYLVPYWMFHFAGGEVTWQAICEAWVKDDFEGRAWTVAIIDRMRQILWDEPFDITWAARVTAPE